MVQYEESLGCYKSSLFPIRGPNHILHRNTNKIFNTRWKVKMMKIKDLRVENSGFRPNEIVYPNSKVVNYYSNLRHLEFGPLKWAGFGSLSTIAAVSDNGDRSEMITSDAAASVIDNLRDFIIGTDLEGTERIFDELYRLTLPYGRNGTTMMALSTIDLLMWDLKGKAYQRPLYKMLGGPTREEIPIYASHPANANNEVLARQLVEYVDKGYSAIKIRFCYGPIDGASGIEKNAYTLKYLRDVLGYRVDIMIDALMSWNLWYSEKIIDKIAKYELSWIEEPFLPDDFDSLRILSKRTDIPLSAGEHAYGLREFKMLADSGVHILQPDAFTSGGITTLMKVGALSESYGLVVIPHTSNFPNLHFAFSCLPSVCPMIENYKWLEQFSKEDAHIERGAVFISGLNKPGIGSSFELKT